MARWQENEIDIDLQRMGKFLQWPESLCRVLANRNIKDSHGAIRYFHPKLANMHDATLFKNMDKALDRVILALANEENITIFGDYDVDGVMGTVILAKSLQHLTKKLSFAIPDRQKDGYGLSMGIVEELKENGTELLITVDNGIAAEKEIQKAKALGIDVLVLDHHEPQIGQQIEAIVVNAKQKDCSYPFKELCAAGLSYKFSESLYEKLQTPWVIADEMLIFAAIATVADMVPLQDENRIIVTEGLKRLHRSTSENLGLEALLKALDLHDKAIDTRDIGFRIGPVINAAGRIAHGKIPVELFLTQDVEMAREIATKLIGINQERQAITAAAVKEANVFMETTSNDDMIKVFYLPEMHESVAGIVAGRIKEAIHLPVIILTDGIETVKGSGRSMAPYDMFIELEKQKNLLLEFGGHEMAAGLSLDKKHIESLRKNLNTNNPYQKEDFSPSFTYDAILSPQEIDLRFAKQVAYMAPFGMGNEKPLFKFSAVPIIETKVLGKHKDVLKWTTEENGCKIDIIAFQMLEKFKIFYIDLFDEAAFKDLYDTGKSNQKYSMDLLGTVEINFYYNQQNLQIQMIDFK